MKQSKIKDDLHQEAEAFDSQIEDRILLETEVFHEAVFLFFRRKVSLL